MDIFSACVAFGPLGVYLLLLGLINLARRPLVVSGTRESLSLGLALMGLVVVGPMQLFMPQEAAARFGELVWLLLAGFYLLCLTLLILLSRPRLIVYNISAEQLRPILQEATRRVDPETAWAGPSASLPRAHVHLQMDSFPPLANVSLVSIGDDQSSQGWRRLETALRAGLADSPVVGQPHGLWLALCGVLILTALVCWVADDPQMVAQGLNRMLNP